ncbi:MAG: hypothetical protein WDA04_00530 [Anaerolineaceae bacterium]
MDMTEQFEADLIGLEGRLAGYLGQYAPDSKFVQELKQNLVSSRIFEQRREIGAIVVASLTLLLAGSIAFSVAQIIHWAKKPSLH